MNTTVINIMIRFSVLWPPQLLTAQNIRKQGRYFKKWWQQWSLQNHKIFCTWTL